MASSHEAGPRRLTTALRRVPLLWYVPAAVVMLRRHGVLTTAD
ncbi:hypothetical protein PJ267_03920 [Arthrobacter sp. OVS8]|jgi:hypothetical protein|nr:hypothetical protein PJ267_03920 [Arthrobacter sp. OVS8]